MPSSLPISRIVNVGVQLTPAGAQAQSLSNLMILGTSAIIDTVERYRVYNTLTQVAADFGTSAEEYKAASRWFGQAPQPTAVYIGRWAKTASSGGLKAGTLSAAQQVMTVWNAVTTGAFKIAKDGAAAADVTGLNFSAAANMNAVAAIIQAAAGMSGTTVVWNASYARFEITSTTTGATSAISFLQAPGTGTDISTMMAGRSTSGGAYVFTGAIPETAVSVVTALDTMIGQQWYGLVVPSAVDADHLAIAAYIQGANTKHFYGITSQDAGILSSVTTTDIAYQMQQLGYSRVMVQYSSSDPNAVASALGRILTTNYNGSNTVMTLKFKVEPGVAPETLNSSQVTAAEAKNANLFVAYNNGTAILEQGVASNGTFVDIVTSTDWLAITIQTALYNLLYTSTTKIPQTDAGQGILLTQCEAICAQGVINGMLAPGVWNANGFGTLNQGDYLAKGYYVYAASFNTQLQSDRSARKAMPIQIAAKLAGAIHSVDVLITVNQ